MPPKPKFSREEILEAAFQLARENGIEAVKAREVGQKLGCSSRPIFTYFNGMEDLQNAVRKRADKLFFEYLRIADNYDLAFKMRGLQMIRFTKDEPNLFQLLFMQEQAPRSFEELVNGKILYFKSDIEDIRQNYEVTEKEAERLFTHLLLTAFSICNLCAGRVCTFTEAEVTSLLGETFAGTLLLLKSGVSALTAKVPKKKADTANSPKIFPLPKT